MLTCSQTQRWLLAAWVSSRQADLVQDAFNAHNFTGRNATATDLKVDVVEYARNTWPREFSLPYYECTVRQGMGHGQWDLLAVTHNGKYDGLV